MQFFLAVITDVNWTEQLNVLHTYLCEQNHSLEKQLKPIIFTIGVQEYDVKKILGGMPEVIELVSEQRWKDNLRLFESFFETRLSQLYGYPVHIFLNTSTCSISAMLLSKATEYLGEEIKPLFSSSCGIEKLEVEEVIPSNKLIDLLCYFLINFDYKAALDLINEKDFLLYIDKIEQYEALKSAVTAMVYRANFDFPRARNYWQNAFPIFKNNTGLFNYTTDLFDRLMTTTIESEKEKIHEVSRQMLVRLQTSDISGFLTRLYRFRELVVHFIWNFGQPNPGRLNHRLPAYEQLDIIRERMADGTITGFRTTYFFANNGSLASALSIRNKSFIAHGRKGFSTKEWLTTYTGNDQSLFKAIDEFEQEVTFLFEDLGISADHNYKDISKYLASFSKLHKNKC